MGTEDTLYDGFSYDTKQIQFMLFIFTKTFCSSHVPPLVHSLYGECLMLCSSTPPSLSSRVQRPNTTFQSCVFGFSEANG